MDKQTLSNYGWLIIITLILAVMLAFATPFGTYVGDGVVSVANGFVGTSDDATNTQNISQESIEWSVKTDHGIDYNTFKYYNNLEDAVKAVNENSYITASSKLGNNKVVVGISKDGNVPVVRLIKNIKPDKHIMITNNCILDINGNRIDLDTNSSINIKNADITIMDFYKNGFIYKKETMDGVIQFAINVYGTSNVVLNNINGYTETDSNSCCVFAYIAKNAQNSVMELNNCKLKTSSNIKAYQNSIAYSSDCIASNSTTSTFNVNNCDFESYGVYVTTIFSRGDLNINGGTYKGVFDIQHDKNFIANTCVIRNFNKNTNVKNAKVEVLVKGVPATPSAILNSGIINVENVHIYISGTGKAVIVDDSTNAPYFTGITTKRTDAGKSIEDENRNEELDTNIYNGKVETTLKNCTINVESDNTILYGIRNFEGVKTELYNCSININSLSSKNIVIAQSNVSTNETILRNCSLKGFKEYNINSAQYIKDEKTIFKKS